VCAKRRKGPKRRVADTRCADAACRAAELQWTLEYVVGDSSTVLDTQRTGVLALGPCRVALEAAAPSWRAVPAADVLGDHTLTLTCSYGDEDCLCWAWEVSTAADATTRRRATPAQPVLEHVTRRLAAANPRLVLWRCVYDESSLRAAEAAAAATQHAAGELEREAAHAAWRARLLSGNPADRARLHLLGVSLAQALGASQDDDAALLFLAQLPLDERLKCSALSRRWRRLALTPALFEELRFDDVALPARFMACGDDTSGPVAVLTGLLARAGPALRALDVRALDAVWCKAQASRWPILTAATVLRLLDAAAEAAGVAAPAQRQLAEVQLADGSPLVLTPQLARLLPPACPHMAHLSCRVFLLLDASVPALLRRLPRVGDVRLVLVKHKAGATKKRAAAALVGRVCAALGSAPAVTSVEFSYGYPVYMRQCYRAEDRSWKHGLDGITIAALAAGLQAQRTHRVQRLDFRGEELTAAAVDALESLLRSCGGEAGAAAEEGVSSSALQEVDLRDADGLDQPARARLVAAAAASGVRVQLSDEATADEEEEE
jgi:hypothetical protein